MNGKPDKSDIYELILEKVILRKMKEQNDEVGKSLEVLNRLITNQCGNESATTTSTTTSTTGATTNGKRGGSSGKKSVMTAVMEQKYNKHASLESFYQTMRLEKSALELDSPPSIYPNYTYGYSSVTPTATTIAASTIPTAKASTIPSSPKQIKENTEE